MPFLAEADSTTRIEITPMENYVAYPGDTVQQFVDVEYFGEDATTLKLQLQFIPQSTFSGNGQEILFDSGETNRFYWTITLPQSTAYSNQTLGISIIDLKTAVQSKSFTAQFLHDCRIWIIFIGYRSHCRVSISIGDQVDKQYLIVYH